MERHQRTVRRGLAVCGLIAALGLVASPTEAQDPPSGGGAGCQSNGNCQGTLYTDKTNLDRWWYRLCSGCHAVQAPPPKDVVTTLTTFQKALLADAKQFKPFHDRAVTDPTLKVLVPRAKLLAPQLLAPPYRTLMTR